MSEAHDKSVADLAIYHRLVGLVASEWANLDLHLDLLIWELAEVQQMLGACITTQIGSTGARFRSLVALLRLREAPEDLIGEVKSYQGRTEAIVLKRNRIVHDTWIFDPKQKEALQIQIVVEGKQLKMGIAPVPLPELRKTQKAISAHVTKFVVLAKKIESWRESSSQKWREQLGHIQWKSREDQAEGTNKLGE